MNQKEAIARLLGDDDPSTVNLVKEQLVNRGEDAVDDLHLLLEEKDENVRLHAGEVLAEIDARQASAELSILCPLFHEEGDIEHASWLLARALLPGTDVEEWRGTIDKYGRELMPLLTGAMTARDRIEIISAYLCKRKGYRGNVDDYYNAENSLLPCLIETRLGIPISLTLLYLLAGARAGMRIEGINLPGHFLARHNGVLFDPYDNGKIMTLADCNEILERQNLTFSPEHIVVATPRAMFRRMLTNLLYIFQNDGDEALAARLAEWVNGLDRS
jgi:regulator of sirC expression with transglutaminase-like and TPR domain